jgi:predicted DNA-binding transcriptional regulator AlpA
MSIPSTGRGGRWARNGRTAQYLGVSNMTLWRWKRDPDLDFPDASEINGIEFNNLDRIDEWMRSRLVKRHGGKR